MEKLIYGIESWSCLCGKGPLKFISSNPSAKGRNIFRLFWVMRLKELFHLAKEELYVNVIIPL